MSLPKGSERVRLVEIDWLGTWPPVYVNFGKLIKACTIVSFDFNAVRKCKQTHNIGGASRHQCIIYISIDVPFYGLEDSLLTNAEYTQIPNPHESFCHDDCLVLGTTVRRLTGFKQVAWLNTMGEASSKLKLYSLSLQASLLTDLYIIVNGWASGG